MTATIAPTATPKFIQTGNFDKVKLLHTISETKVINSYAFSPDSDFLAYAGQFGAINVVDLTTGQLVAEVPTVDQITTLGWSPSGRYLAAGIVLGQVMVVDTQNWQEVAFFQSGNRNAISKVGWSSDDLMVVGISGSGNNIPSTVYSWQFSQGTLITEGLTNPVFYNNQTCWDSDSRIISIIGYPDKSRTPYWVLFDFESGLVLNQRALKFAANRTFCNSTTGEILLLENRSNGTTVVVNAETEQDIAALPSEGEYSGFCLSSETTILARRNKDHITLTEFFTSENIGEIPIDAPYTRNVEWSPDCSKLAFQVRTNLVVGTYGDTYDPTIEIWGLP